jgi:hypothetical protein
MARLLPQVPGMTYAHDDNDLYITFFAESRTEVELNGTRVKVEQKTAYPNDGEISVSINPAKPTKFRLQLRIPTWAQDRFVPGELYRYANTSFNGKPKATASGGVEQRANTDASGLPLNEQITLSVNGDRINAPIEKGFASIEREWRADDRVVLRLPMPVRITECHPAVKANTNRIAFTRGPFVLCAEGVDNGGATKRFFFDKMPDTSDTKIKTTRIKSGSFIQADVPAQAVTRSSDTETTNLVLTPYYAWNNRGTSSMTVWFPRDKSLAVFDPHVLPKESIFSKITASHTSPLDTVSAIGDGKEPRWSSGKKVPRWTSRRQNGKPQWIEARFAETKQVRHIGVYWMQDQFDVKFPAEWSLEVEQAGKWKAFELYTTDRYDTRANQYNVVHPAAPLKCDAIRIRMTPKENACVGLLEVQVAFEE